MKEVPPTDDEGGNLNDDVETKLLGKIDDKPNTSDVDTVDDADGAVLSKPMPMSISMTMTPIPMLSDEDCLSIDKDKGKSASNYIDLKEDSDEAFDDDRTESKMVVEECPIASEMIPPASESDSGSSVTTSFRKVIPASSFVAELSMLEEEEEKTMENKEKDLDEKESWTKVKRKKSRKSSKPRQIKTFISTDEDNVGNCNQGADNTISGSGCLKISQKSNLDDHLELPMSASASSKSKVNPKKTTKKVDFSASKYFLLENSSHSSNSENDTTHNRDENVKVDHETDHDAVDDISTKCDNEDDFKNQQQHDSVTSSDRSPVTISTCVMKPDFGATAFSEPKPMLLHHSHSHHCRLQRRYHQRQRK